MTFIRICFVHCIHLNNEENLVLIESDKQSFRQNIGQLVDIQDSLFAVVNYFINRTRWNGF